MSSIRHGDGPYHLSARALDNVVTRNCPGTFALGECTDDGFQVSYVGRSDTDVNARLQRHVGKYRHFSFDYTADSRAAFDDECALYHDHNPGHNTEHPAPPAASGWPCPRCQNPKPVAT